MTWDAKLQANIFLILTLLVLGVSFAWFYYPSVPWWRGNPNSFASFSDFKFFWKPQVKVNMLQAVGQDKCFQLPYFFPHNSPISTIQCHQLAVLQRLVIWAFNQSAKIKPVTQSVSCRVVLGLENSSSTLNKANNVAVTYFRKKNS